MKVTVRKGDNFSYYSKLFQLPVILLEDSNPEVDPSNLLPGMEVLIPCFTEEIYTLQEGDSIWQLAQERNVSVDVLLLVNQGINPNSLEPGEKIIIPKKIEAPVFNRKREYDYACLLKDLDQLKELFPFIAIAPIGKSVLEKDIFEIKLGRGRKKIHFNASFHANEWITSALLMEFLNAFLLSLANETPIRGQSAAKMYEQAELSIVPMVNPDGVDLVLNGPPSSMKEELVKINRGSTDFTGWKANIRGVDLNNQFPAKWEVEKKRKEEKAPAPRDYPGDAPLSEPETMAMANLTKKENFDRVIAFHTQGEEFYWGYEGTEPPSAEKIAEEMARKSGYLSVRYIDSFAGYKDWFIQDFLRPGFTIEFGKGVNPLPLSQFDEIYDKGLWIFLAAIYM